MVWHDAACLESIDRSQGETLVSLSYEVPKQSPDPTDHSDVMGDDEVADGRTHQFFAFCADPFVPWPSRWIDAADIEAARDVGLDVGDGVALSDAGEFPCWSPITTSAQRRPITDAAAAEPVLWDVSELPPGTYTPWGYTWDPPFNLWAPRSGTAFKIHDGDPNLAGPSIVLTSRDVISQYEEEPRLEGCIDAAQGTVLSVEVAEAREFGGLTWETVADELTVDGPSFELTLPGDWGSNTSSYVRVTATAPDGRQSIAYLHGLLSRLGPPDCDEGNFVEPPECREPSPDPKPPRSPSDDEDTDPENSEPGQDGGRDAAGCRLGAPVALWPLFLLLPSGIGPRRRRTR